MAKSQQSSEVVAVRLTSQERDDVAALAAIEGKALSAYIRDVLRAKAARPRPALAAAGALLGICDALLGAARDEPSDATTVEFVTEQARLVINIIRLHDPDISS